MIKKVLKIISRIIFSSFLLYAYNKIMQPLGFNIPINYITVALITILGIPAFLALILMLIIIY